MNLLRSANPQDIRQCLHGSVPRLAGVQPSSLRAEFTRIYLFNGHEHNSNPCSPSEALVHAVKSFLYSSQRHLARTCVQPARITPSDCALIGPLNLREGLPWNLICLSFAEQCWLKSSVMKDQIEIMKKHKVTYISSREQIVLRC
jgi:hypothetical protein